MTQKGEQLARTGLAKLENTVEIFGMRILWAAVVAVLVLSVGASAAPAVGFLRADGSRLIDENTRRPVVLKGCNLGNWLMIEPWMLGNIDGAKDQVGIINTFKTRFGDERGQRLIDLYRQNFITPRDFELIKTFNFNAVRVPFDYRILQEDEPPYRVRKDAFVHLDRALEMAEAAGVYVILDMHGTPGGNSREMHSGQTNQPGMWGNPTCYQRTADLWREIARRYKDRSVVAAYDLVNEPYGDYRQDLRGELAKLMPQIYRAIREVDDRHVIYFSGPLSGGITFYGDPKAQGMHDVGFTEHFYAGLFGSKPVLESHARDLNQQFPKKQAYVKQLGVPYYVGEFNVVNRIAGGERVMREYFDRMGAYGWTATMWSYKLLRPDGGVKPDQWYIVTNAKPLAKLDLQSASYEDLAGFFESLATMELAVNEPLRTALTEPNPVPLPLAAPEPLPTTAPAGEPPQGWTAVDIGDAMRGGIERGSGGVVTVYASGANIFHTSDSFRFISRPAESASQTLTAQLLSLLNSHAYAKAGVMARWGQEPDAPFAMVNIFPDGTVCLCGRDRRAAEAKEIKLMSAGATPPVDLRIAIDSGHAKGWFRPADGSWHEIGSIDTPADANYRIGLAVTSHENGILTAAKFRVGDGPPLTRPRPAASDSLLTNAPFDHWDSEGEWKRDATTATTVATAAGKELRLGREVDVEPGKRYAFTVSAKRTGDSKDNGTIELRLEGALTNYQVTLNSETFRVADLPGGGKSAPLSVAATPVGSRVRASIIYTPGQGSPAAPITFETPMLSAP